MAPTTYRTVKMHDSLCKEVMVVSYHLRLSIYIFWCNPCLLHRISQWSFNTSLLYWTPEAVYSIEMGHIYWWIGFSDLTWFMVHGSTSWVQTSLQFYHIGEKLKCYSYGALKCQQGFDLEGTFCKILVYISFPFG